MKTIVLAAALFGSVAAQANICSNHQSVIDIASELAASRTGFVSACEIRQVIAAEQRHTEITGSNCDAKVQLVDLIIQSATTEGTTQTLQSKVTVFNAGLGQPVDSYIVTGQMLPDGNGDCVITSVKLAPMSNGR